MKQILRYIFLGLVWLLAGLIFLLVISGLLIQTRPVKNKISHFAEKQAEKVLNGKLTIGKIRGNLFSHLLLEDVLWTNERDTIAFINSMSASYRLPPLIKGELQINAFSINSPYLYLKQQKDSIWNIGALLKKNEDAQKDTTKSSGNFQLFLSQFQISDGSLKIQSNDTIIPEHVNNLNLSADGFYSSVEQRLTVKNFDFHTRRPDFILTSMSFAALRNEKNISLANFRLTTAQNALNAEADYLNNSKTEVSAEMETEPLHLDEFEFLLPDLNLPAHPTIDLETNTSEGGVKATLSVQDEDEHITLDLFSANLLQFVTGGREVDLKYSISGNVDNLNLAHWLGNEKLDYSLNGEFKVDGSGINPEKATIDLQANFKDCVFSDEAIEKINMNLRFEDGNISGKVETEGDFGLVSVIPKIENLFDHPQYDLLVQTQNLNLAPLLNNESLQSKINAEVHINGEYFNPEIIEARADVQLTKSMIADYNLDSLAGILNYRQQNIVIDSLWAKSKSLRLMAGGNYNLAGNSDLELSAEFDNADDFSAFIPLDSIEGQGNVNAHLFGTLDSLTYTATAELQEAGFAQLSAERLILNSKGQLTPKDTSLAGEISVVNFNTGNFEVDSIIASANYYIDSLQIELRANRDDIHTQVESAIAFGDVIKIALLNWKLSFKNQFLELKNAPALVEIDSMEYRLSNLTLASNNSDTAQYVNADGIISQYGEENFQFEIANVDIAGVFESLGIDADISGILNTRGTLGGTAFSPELNGYLDINEAGVYGYEFSDFDGTFDLKNDRLNFDMRVAPVDTGLLNISSNIPLHARFDDMNFFVDADDSIRGEIEIEHFPLSTIPFFVEAQKVDGFLDGKVNVGGTLKSPSPGGNISLNNAEVKFQKYGIDYEDIILDLSFSEDAAQLDSFYIKTDDGNLKASGAVDFSSVLYNGNIKQSEISIQFNSFNLVDHRQFNMELSGNASLKGAPGEVIFDGELEIPESSIYLPAIMNLAGEFTEPELPQPVLMRELEKLKDTVVSTNNSSKNTTFNADSLDLSYLSGVTGRLDIEIPQNTWIKNKDMYVEIAGDLELLKNAEFFELFGTIDIVRGQYNLLGKTFEIEEGTISFQGGEELVPRLNIQAAYAFRNQEQAEQELTVQVLGTAKQPEINFMLDGSRISEGDALSYILFGMEMNALTIDQQENVAGAGEIAGSAAMSLLSSQLTELLGKNLDVDYIELKGDGDFENATVVVGKYITNDLFVSYEQRFGETDEKDISKYEVRLEYELFKFLFLQLNNSSSDSGFDVIIKLDSD